MAMDGEIDYSGFADKELQEALGRIEKDRFPINHQRLLAELEKRRMATDFASSNTAPARFRPEFS